MNKIAQENRSCSLWYSPVLTSKMSKLGHHFMCALAHEPWGSLDLRSELCKKGSNTVY